MNQKNIILMERDMFENTKQRKIVDGQSIIAQLSSGRAFDALFEVHIEFRFMIAKHVSIQSQEWIQNFVEFDSDKVGTMQCLPFFQNLRQTFIVFKQIGLVQNVLKRSTRYD